MKILMVAAENDAISGGKVGGIGDVLRDIPPALAKAGCDVQVVTPGYQAFGKLPGSRRISEFTVQFAGNTETIELFTLESRYPVKGVTLWALEHPWFAAGGAGNIYCDDPPERPFASDAGKFALFCIAVAEAMKTAEFGAIDVLHLHDWHAAMVAVLRAFDPAYKSLQAIRTVYTIHNLALQGIRPLTGDQSSLLSWYPDLQGEFNLITDPRAPNCVNPMRAGINLSDAVHAVSPNYAQEILKPSQPAQGFFGGEGLERDLQAATEQSRLHGILNGCEYPNAPIEALPWPALLELSEQAVLQWLGKETKASSAHIIALSRITHLLKTPAKFDFLLTSVGRITEQKANLLRQDMGGGVTAVQALLDRVGEGGFCILLGSGDAGLEQFFTQVASNNSNFLFLNGYSEALAQALYASGDLFLMPSSFEPCGISQMLAMRAGQPCLVHAVGGLKDTVEDGVNGFAFAGETPVSQAYNMLSLFDEVLHVKAKKNGQWKKIGSRASKARFEWLSVAEKYKKELYS